MEQNSKKVRLVKAILAVKSEAAFILDTTDVNNSGPNFPVKTKSQFFADHPELVAIAKSLNQWPLQ